MVCVSIKWCGTRNMYKLILTIFHKEATWEDIVHSYGCLRCLRMGRGRQKKQKSLTKHEYTNIWMETKAADLHVGTMVQRESREWVLRKYSNRWKMANSKVFSFSKARILCCESFQVLDYTQYYLDLESANSKKDGAPAWQSEYNLTTYYHGLGEISREISAVSLHNLADRFTNPEDVLFSK